MICYEQLHKNLHKYQSYFSLAKPYKHLIIDDFLKADYATMLHAEFEDNLVSCSPKTHENVKFKTTSNKICLMSNIFQEFFREINSKEWLNVLSELTGIKTIYSDETLKGAGLHKISKGGFLNIHTDFNFHPKTSLYRRLNFIYYLNIDWNIEWGGELELWNRDVSSCSLEISPIFNRAVIFETSDISFHGHPRPLRCGNENSRKSCAVYYYSEWPTGVIKRDNTNYQLTPWQKNVLAEDIKWCLEQGISKQQLKKALPQWRSVDINNLIFEFKIDGTSVISEVIR